MVIFLPFRLLGNPYTFITAISSTWMDKSSTFNGVGNLSKTIICAAFVNSF